MASRLDPQTAAEKAVLAIGSGYDITDDIRFSACKPGLSVSSLIVMDQSVKKDMVLPCGRVVSSVSPSISCGRGDRTRFSSDVLSFAQMAEQFNQDISLSGKIPSGLFNMMFDFKGCWQKDAATTKTLAFDGWLITMYNIVLSKSQITLSEHVKKEVPSSWDPAALAEFIEKFGTHIVVGVTMGGKDVIHLKQLQKSNLQPTEVQRILKQVADQRFSEDVNVSLVQNPDKSSGTQKEGKSSTWDLNPPFSNILRSPVVSLSKNDDLLSIRIRRGGFDVGQSHQKWLSTVSQYPSAISMSFVPISSLLNGVRGSGFLSHAINLYLRYKPPREELQQFLEFQVPRQWAPAYGDLPLAPRRQKQASPSLKFTFMGPKLYVNTVKVDSENRPVTGIRLYLEAEKGYLEAVKWSIFSHVCTQPVQYNGARIDDSASIVTKAWLEVKGIGMKKVLFLRLGFSVVASARIRRSEWDGHTMSSRKSGLMSMLITTPFSSPLTEPAVPAKVDLNSAVYPGGPPSPARAPKMFSFVDTKEMVRGPEEPPGYWVVTGARLCVDGGRIRVKVKYSLLIITSEDSSI
ncbi:MACPF domain-containing protein [Heracleum sosnowskyi]|uniref:MACPF domain-containing protein n=1 Tax=Heracleum sosnowskyi TaxID=360622 RepID=A0AAD8I481_9APIA|nr:MACPF domain-containing protein [Heracleum sosnowskyi]